jgi:HEAT repeat protein
MSAYPELDGLTLDELYTRFLGPPIDDPLYAVAYYGEVAYRIGQAGAQGVSFLVRALDDPYEARVRAAIGALGDLRSQAPEFQRRLLESLDESRPLVLMEAVDALAKLQYRAAKPRILALGAHTSPFVRSSVLRYESSLDGSAAVPDLVEAMLDPDPIVRQSAADELGNIGDPAALVPLQRLLNDPDPDTREAAQTAIGNIQYVIQSPPRVETQNGKHE